MGLALKRTQELTLRALPRYRSDLELMVGESRPPGWGLPQRRDSRWPIRRRGRAGLRRRGASCGKLGSSVTGLERGGGGGTAGSQRPPGAWTPRSARARLLAASSTRPPRVPRPTQPDKRRGIPALPSPAPGGSPAPGWSPLHSPLQTLR